MYIYATLYMIDEYRHRRMARYVSAMANTSVYLYDFRVPLSGNLPPVPNLPQAGVIHHMNLFLQYGLIFNTTQAAQQLQRQLSDYWMYFVVSHYHTVSYHELCSMEIPSPTTLLTHTRYENNNQYPDLSIYIPPQSPCHSLTDSEHIQSNGFCCIIFHCIAFHLYSIPFHSTTFHFIGEFVGQS
jgi:hypothetical protein